MCQSSSSNRRVVITGIGVITALGQDPETLWKNLLEGKSGVSRISSFNADPYDAKIAAEVKEFDAAPFFKNPKEVRRCDRYTQMAMVAAKKSVQDAGLDFSKEDLDKVGVFVSSGIGGLQTLETQHHVLIEKGPSRLSPFVIPMLISNMASGMISMEFGIRGPNMAIVSACSTGAHSIGESFHTIRRGDADVMLAGGSESPICPMGVGGFSAMKALSTRNDAPEKASRPFDKDRDGFVMGEGAGVLVIEELEHAKKRGARIYCELVGYGSTADAHHMTAPSPNGEGAARCMQMAFRVAGITPADVGYINAHGTSTPQGDICETKAVKSVFGEGAKKVMVSSTKSMTAHLLGAAGAVEMAVCAKVIQTGWVPPTINLDNPDPECDLDYVPHRARQVKVEIAASNSFGFGGHNSTLVGKKFV